MYTCTSCRKEYDRTNKMTICKPCNVARVLRQSEEQKMWRAARRRATVRGQEFSIDVEDIVIPDTCPILGIKLEHMRGKPGGNHYSPSLDRKDNAKGYIKGNVWVISNLANMMKSSATIAELYKFGLWAVENYRKYYPEEKQESLASQ